MSTFFFMTSSIHVLFKDDKTDKEGMLLFSFDLIATRIFCLMDGMLEIKHVF